MDTKEFPVGVVGLGLMGCSITTCLLMAGHPVIALAPIPADIEFAASRVREHLRKSQEEQLVNQPPDFYMANLVITEDYQLLQSCKLVIECTIENLAIKKIVFEK